MSEMYSNEYSNFPSQVITKHNFKNIDSSTAPLISQINTLRSQGKYSEASELIKANANTLSKCIADAEFFRMWEEEIYNTQTYALQISSSQQYVYFDSEPSKCDVGDLWIGA